MTRKPILTIFYQFNPWQSSIGGIQTVIRSFIKYAPDKFQIRLVGTGKPNSAIGVWQEADYAGRAIQFMPLVGIENDDVRGLIPTSVKYTVALIGRNFASDFMHFHRIEPTLFALKWRGEKSLFVHNDIQQQVNSTNNKNAILWKYFPQGYFALENAVIKQFTQVYVCNTEALKFYRQQYSNLVERINYVKNAVDNEIFHSITLEHKQKQRKHFASQLSLADNTQFILFAGRLHPQKDPILLLRSFAALKTAQVHLLIAGEGDLANEVRAEIDSLGISQQVTMLGAVDRQKMAELYRLASVFILTSVYEGLPIVVLEALACGTPIVTTKAGETPKILTSDSGVVARDRTPEAIAEALQQVLLNSADYPIEACVRVARPYAAKTVIKNVYDRMWQNWQHQNLSVA
ncbi:glycosyltransferase family 4 protein [Myxosarcina sp. GI1]|uniref:glycosyltransferase family 4 protein n=1 Tax=Myxosarcina sp. GI1 TaxID=1541065 RepID=UPI0005638122|nr:glycosyltransferase family 4 protein [Myxosarcina sp. GI1]